MRGFGRGFNRGRGFGIRQERRGFGEDSQRGFRCRFADDEFVPGEGRKEMMQRFQQRYKRGVGMRYRHNISGRVGAED